MSINKVFRLFILGLSSSILIYSCKQPEYKYTQGDAQGTTYHITYQSEKNFAVEIDSILKAFDKSLSTWDSTSIITRVNKNDSTVKIDSLFAQVFRKAQEVNRESDGMFDITVGPLVRTWGFYKKNKTVPDSAKIEELLVNVGMNKIRLENGKIIKQTPGIILDDNAIAQGFSVDVVSAYLEKHGVKNYLVEIGGELKGKGVNAKGEEWRVGIDKPIDGNQEAGAKLQTIVHLKDKAMATSGNYRNYFIENGVKYAHHLNPKTGYPSKNTLLSVTIVANDCMTADAFGTACIVSGFEKTLKILDKRKDLEAYLIYSDNQGKFRVYTTKGLKDLL